MFGRRKRQAQVPLDAEELRLLALAEAERDADPTVQEIVPSKRTILGSLFSFRKTHTGGQVPTVWQGSYEAMSADDIAAAAEFRSLEDRRKRD